MRDIYTRWGRFKATPTKQILPMTYFDTGVGVFYVDLPAKLVRQVGPQAIKQELAASFTSGPCGHQYDCCGCVHHQAYTKRVKRNRWRVMLASNRNY